MYFNLEHSLCVIYLSFKPKICLEHDFIDFCQPWQSGRVSQCHSPSLCLLGPISRLIIIVLVVLLVELDWKMVIRIHAGTYLGERGAAVLEPPKPQKMTNFGLEPPLPPKLKLQFAPGSRRLLAPSKYISTSKKIGRNTRMPIEKFKGYTINAFFCISKGPAGWMLHFVWGRQLWIWLSPPYTTPRANATTFERLACMSAITIPKARECANLSQIHSIYPRVYGTPLKKF